MTVSWSIHIAANGIILSLWLSNIPLYLCSTLLNPFLCQCTFRLLPCLDYCRQCCSYHWADVSFWIIIFSENMSRSGTTGPYGSSIFNFFSVLLLLFFPLYFFNWRIFALKNFVVFCHTSTWISHRYTHVHSLLNLPSIAFPTPPS